MNSGQYDRWADIVDRETSGEEVSVEELEFARSFESVDPLARAEASVFSELRRGVSVDELAANGAAAERAVTAVLLQRAAERRRTARRIAWSAASLSVAAGIALWMVRKDRVSPEPKVLATSVVEYTDGAVAVDGKPAALGARIGIGSEVSVASGVACVAVEPTIHVCLGAGSTARVRKVDGASKEIELLSGRLATALDPLPTGQHYSIVARDVWVTAVGTAFSVELLSSSVKTVVHEGKVRVGTDASTGNVVTAHKIGLSTSGGGSVEDLVDHVPTETPDWKALAAVAHRSIEAPMGVPKPETTPPPIVETAPAATRPSIERREAKAPVVEEHTETAADLLARARQALRNQSWQEAATAYRGIISRFPSSPEARTVLVPLAGLEIDRLNQAEVALGHLGTYLASGGALAMEARLARIRAYRALGRKAEEARAIDEFLEAHPSSLEAPRLRERRQDLP